MVNRLWQHHFGVGIVATPSDFGVMGDAADASANCSTGWRRSSWRAVGASKHMHRLMVLSAAYCQDSRVDPDDARCAKALEVDRDNHLLWHARRRRLEGEETARRDAGRLRRIEPAHVRRQRPAEAARPDQQLRLDARRAAGGPEPPVGLRLRQAEHALSAVRRLRPARHAQQLRPPGRHDDGAAGAVLLNGEFTLERARRLGADLAKQYPPTTPAWRRKRIGSPGAGRRPTTRLRWR